MKAKGMEDHRAWDIEESLWTGDPAQYPKLIDHECLMVVPADPAIVSAEAALRSMSKGPRWSRVAFTDGHIARPEKGLLVLAYTVQAGRDDGTNYVARCTSTWRRHRHADWRLVQHQQSPQA
ncbi:DUF4440 domain-containing protein [Tabrizicola sp.]|uniref:DUF4440 domain-containing protein n=1 Tax=Tabrizicola sp. TaxID=2005166 RepID=UPI0025E1FB4F|nr:DUF4440 domain-containing protein [Tabrizicola sp.]